MAPKHDTGKYWNSRFQVDIFTQNIMKGHIKTSDIIFFFILLILFPCY